MESSRFNETEIFFSVTANLLSLCRKIVTDFIQIFYFSYLSYCFPFFLPAFWLRLLDVPRREESSLDTLEKGVVEKDHAAVETMC